ncbi:MAG TPA: hypothetical protein VD997_15950 [Phycisphaerales bacterium]|nr:hypothetical protein [Phycisphaerales bacterium]
MVESLRLFGGRFAACEVLLAVSRPSPPLLASTRARLRELRATLVDIPYRRRYRWHHLMNKPHALFWGEQLSRAETIIWADSDILFLDEPHELELAPGEEFVGQPDTGVIGSTGEDDPHDPFWARMCAEFGVEFERMPWCFTYDNQPIRYYLNSGLFAYRRTCALGRDFEHDCVRFLDRGVSTCHTEVHFGEQATLGITVLRRRLNRRTLSHDGNFHTTLITPWMMDAARMRGATVLHYHDCMGPHTWGRMMGALQGSHPRVHEWIRHKRPLTNDHGTVCHRACREWLRVWRGVMRRLNYARNHITKPPKDPPPTILQENG